MEEVEGYVTKVNKVPDKLGPKGPSKLLTSGASTKPKFGKYKIKSSHKNST